MGEKSGSPFERLVAAVQKKLDPGSEVMWLERITVGELVYEVDVSVRGTMGSAHIFLAIEAKDYADKVGRQLVDAFESKLRDIKANKGIIVSRSGFTRDALVKAAASRIDTCVLRGATDDDWVGRVRHVTGRVILAIPRYRRIELILDNNRTVGVAQQHPIVISNHEMEIGALFEHYAVETGALHSQERRIPLDFVATVPVHIQIEGQEHTIRQFRGVLEFGESEPETVRASSRKDAVFVQHTPEGEIEDEKQFFEFRDLEEFADALRAQ